MRKKVTPKKVGILLKIGNPAESIDWPSVQFKTATKSKFTNPLTGNRERVFNVRVAPFNCRFNDLRLPRLVAPQILIGPNVCAFRLINQVPGLGTALSEEKKGARVEIAVIFERFFERACSIHVIPLDYESASDFIATVAKRLARPFTFGPSSP